MPQEVLDRLPDLNFDGRPIRWTRELFTSVVYFCMPNVHVINHAAAPYDITSLLVPTVVPKETDGIEYMIHIFKLRNPHSPGGSYGDMAYQAQALKFLLENNVRQKSSQKLQTEIAELLKRETI